MKLIVTKTRVLRSVVLLAKLLLPGVICFLFIYYGDGYNNFIIFTIPFSTLIVLFNLNKKKYHLLITIILSFIISLVAFGSALMVNLGLGYPIEFLFNLFNLTDNFSELILKLIGIVSYSFVAPTIIFIGYKKLFEINKGKTTKYTFYISCFLLLILLFNSHINGNFTIAIWQFVVALALQVVFNQEGLKRF